MDLGHTKDNMYFTFHPLAFNETALELMKATINVSDRRMVVITDPHIKTDQTYYVYKKGHELER